MLRADGRRPSASSSTQQDFFVFLITIYVGAGLIANDRRANALQIYLSKPLMRTEYIAGKAAVLFFFLLLVTWVPGDPAAPRAGAVRRQLRVPAEEPVPVPGDHRRRRCCRCCSRRSRCWRCRRSRRAAATSPILYAGIIFFTAAIYGVLFAITGSSTLVVDLAGRPAWRRSSTSSSGMPPRYETPWQVSLIVIVGLIVVSISVLERRVRGVEVVT